MRFTDYEDGTESTAVYPGVGGKSMRALDDLVLAAQAALPHFWKPYVDPVLQLSRILYCTLGLTGEAGEVAEKVKKMLRDKGGVVDDEFREAVKGEVGDTLWYLARLSKECGFTLEEAAVANLHKLESRKARGVLNGSGDNR